MPVRGNGERCNGTAALQAVQELVPERNDWVDHGVQRHKRHTREAGGLVGHQRNAGRRGGRDPLDAQVEPDVVRRAAVPATHIPVGIATQFCRSIVRADDAVPKQEHGRVRKCRQITGGHGGVRR